MRGQSRKFSIMTVQQRLESNRKITVDGHWLWLGAVDRHGYGRIAIDRVNSLVHRVAYSLYNGVAIPNRVLVLHKPPCVGPNCFNPTHLYLGDHKQNSKDASEAGVLNTEENRNKKFWESERKFLESVEKQVMDGFKE
jgi:hypothetical protein